MKLIKSTLIPVAMAISMAGFSAASQADAIAEAVVNLTNFQIYKYDTVADTKGTQVDSADLSGLAFTSSADTKATLNGATADATDAIQTDFEGDLYSSVGAVSGYADNQFTLIAGVPPVPGSFAASDTKESGAPITGLTLTDADGNPVTDADGNPIPVTASADISNAAISSALGSSDASSQSNNTLSASFEFSTTPGWDTNDGMVFNFDVLADLYAYLDPDQVSPATATAKYTISYSLKDLTDNKSVLLNGFGVGTVSITDNVGLNAPLGAGLESTSHLDDSFALFTVALAADHKFQLVGTVDTFADATSVPVPEPGVMFLLGVGLAGLGFARKRVDVK